MIRTRSRSKAPQKNEWLSRPKTWRKLGQIELSILVAESNPKDKDRVVGIILTLVAKK